MFTRIGSPMSRVALCGAARAVVLHKGQAYNASSCSCSSSAREVYEPPVRAHPIHAFSAGGTKLESHFPIRNDWTFGEVKALYNQPLVELMHLAGSALRAYWDPTKVQQCTLLSIKTGGCQENCKYCSQSSKNKADVKPEPLIPTEEVLKAARQAKEAGSTRFCMGTAWRGPSTVGPRQFGRILDMISQVRGMGMEVCATLGFLTLEQAKQLHDAGLSVYNHNLNTSKEYHHEVVTTHTFEDRLNTVRIAQEAGMKVCCGGIIGLGEQHEDRISLLHALASMPEHPESVPVNSIVANKGTPLEGMPKVPVWEVIRAIATARILMPKSVIRLSAGRSFMSPAEQALCFMSGANSIFTGDKLLTTPNSPSNEDKALFEALGLTGMEATIEAQI